MSLPFDFFFGILGLVAGMVIVWLLESRRAFESNEEPWELPDPVEPAFIAAEMAKRGRPLAEDVVTEVLEMHLAYLDGRAAEEQVRTERETVARARREMAAAIAERDGTPQPVGADEDAESSPDADASADATDAASEPAGPTPAGDTPEAEAEAAAPRRGGRAE